MLHRQRVGAWFQLGNGVLPGGRGLDRAPLVRSRIGDGELRAIDGRVRRIDDASGEIGTVTLSTREQGGPGPKSAIEYWSMECAFARVSGESLYFAFAIWLQLIDGLVRHGAGPSEKLGVDFGGREIDNQEAVLFEAGLLFDHFQVMRR